MCNKTKAKLNGLLGIGAAVVLLTITIFLAQRPHTVITINQAKTVAEMEIFGAKAVDAILKTKPGIKVYDIQLNNGFKVSVDARSGVIIKTEYKANEEPQNSF